MVTITKKILVRLSPATPTAASVLTVELHVPSEETHPSHRLRVALLDQLGRPVTVPTVLGDKPFELTSDFEVGHAPGAKTCPSITLDLGFSVAPVPLQANQVYTWRCWIDDRTEDGWCVQFSTRSRVDVEGGGNGRDP